MIRIRASLTGLFRKYYCCILSALIVFLAMAVVLLINKCAPFGTTSLTYGDGEIQYLDFFSYLHDILHGKNDLTYSFTIGMGQSGWGLYTYYLASPLNLMVFFFRKDQIKSFFDLLILLKLSLCAFTMSLYLVRRSEGKVNNIFCTVLSISYAMMQYNISQASNIMWLDGVYMLPLMLLGIYELISKNKTILLIVSTALSILFSWYSAGMNCVFTVFWFFFELALYNCDESKGLKKNLGSIGRYALAMASGVMISAFSMIPNYLLLKNGRGESVDKWLFGFDITGNPVTLFSKYMLGGRNDLTTDMAIFSGSFLLICAVSYFFNGKEKKRRLYVAFFGILVMLMYCWQPLVACFSLFKQTNSYWCRYSYMAVFYLVFIAVLNLSASHDSKKKRIISVLAVWAVCSAFLFWPQTFQKENTGLVILSIISSLCAAVLLLLSSVSGAKIRRAASLLLAVLTALELGYNASLLIGTYSTDSGSQFRDYTLEEEKTISGIKDSDSGIYRISAVAGRDYDPGQSLQFTYNDGMAHNYSGIASYTSYPEKSYIMLINRLGYKSEEDCITIVNTSVAPSDALLDVKYVISPREISGYKLVEENSSFGRNVYLNPYCIPMGIAYSVKEPSKCSNSFEYINSLYSELLGRDAEVFVKAEYISEDSGNTRRYNITLPQGTDHLYGNIYSGARLDGTVDVNGQYKTLYSGWGAPALFDIPSDGSSALLDYTCSDVSKISDEQFYAFSESGLLDICTELADRSCVIREFSNGHIKCSIDAKTGEDHLFLPVIRSEGWTCKVNGKKVSMDLFAGSMMSVPLEQGANEIELSYHLPGRTSGIILSLAGTAILAFVAVIERKRGKSA